MRGRRLASGAALTLTLLLVPAIAARSAPPGPGIPGAVRTDQLPNGLRIVLAPDSDAAAVDVAVCYDAGFSAEWPGQAGIAHLFEHLMFDGSAHVPRHGHQARIEALGGTAGAVTTADGIYFFETVPASGLDTALVLEADRMTGLVLDATRLDSERAAMSVERQQALLASPLLDGQQRLAEHAWAGHPYHSPVTGSAADLAKLTLKNVREWYRVHYGPNRTVLTVVGRFDPDEALSQIRARFGSLQGGEAAAPAPKLAPPGSERRAWAEGALPFRVLLVGWNGPGRGEPDGAALTLAAALLGRGDTATLRRDLVSGRHLCFFTDGDVDMRRDGSLLVLTAGLQPDADSAAVEQAVAAAVAKLASTPPADEELAGARRRLENSLLFGWQTTRGRGQSLGSAMAMTGDIATANRDLERLRACTPADVQKAAAKWLIESHRTVVWMAARPAPTSRGGR
jgi:zinc protease